MKETQFTKAYTIKEVSRKINVPSGTIRQWEKDLIGLLTIPRTRQGARFYTDLEIELLIKIKQMRNKNLSKDMIRELLQKHRDDVPNVVSESDSETVETVLPAVQKSQPLDFNANDFFAALEVYKQEFLHEMKSEIRNGLRAEVVDEVKKDIASGSLQTIKAISLSIQRTKEKIQDELTDINQHVAKSSEQASESFDNLSMDMEVANKGTSEMISALSDDVVKLSKGTSRDISNLTSNVTKVTKRELAVLKENLTKLSKGTTKDIFMLSEVVAKLSEGTSKEVSTLSNNLVKFSRGTSEELNALSSRLEESSDEFKILTDYISESKEMTQSELTTLNEQLALDREYYLEALKQEREHFRGEVRQRDEIFKDMVISFRDAASAKEKPKKWWKPWSP